MKVNNPNNYNIKIKKSSLDVFINGSKVGKTKIKNNVVLKKNYQDVYSVYLMVSEKDLKGSALASIRSLVTGSMKIRLKGDVKTKVYGVGKKFPIDIEEPVNLRSLF